MKLSAPTIAKPRTGTIRRVDEKAAAKAAIDVTKPSASELLKPVAVEEQTIAALQSMRETTWTLFADEQRDYGAASWPDDLAAQNTQKMGALGRFGLTVSTDRAAQKRKLKHTFEKVLRHADVDLRARLSRMADSFSFNPARGLSDELIDDYAERFSVHFGDVVNDIEANISLEVITNAMPPALADELTSNVQALRASRSELLRTPEGEMLFNTLASAFMTDPYPWDLILPNVDISMEKNGQRMLELSLAALHPTTGDEVKALVKHALQADRPRRQKIFDIFSGPLDGKRSAAIERYDAFSSFRQAVVDQAYAEAKSKGASASEHSIISERFDTKTAGRSITQMVLDILEPAIRLAIDGDRRALDDVMAFLPDGETKVSVTASLLDAFDIE